MQRVLQIGKLQLLKYLILEHYQLVLERHQSTNKPIDNWMLMSRRQLGRGRQTSVISFRPSNSRTLQLFMRMVLTRSLLWLRGLVRVGIKL